jgi:hypothetical protein
VGLSWVPLAWDVFLVPLLALLVQALASVPPRSLYRAFNYLYFSRFLLINCIPSQGELNGGREIDAGAKRPKQASKFEQRRKP